MSAEILLFLVFGAAMVIAMAWDLATFEIPDTISVVLVVVALIALIAGGASIGRVLAHLGLAVAAFAVGLVLFVTRLWGGGDVKFLSAITLWLVPADLPAFIVMVSLAGGVLAVMVLLLRRINPPGRRPMPGWITRLSDPAEGLPYGVALGFGGLMAIPHAVAGVLGT